MSVPSEINFTLADVFGTIPYSGNSLAIFHNARDLAQVQRQLITQEVRHFESIFLHETGSAMRYRAHIHTIEEELDFAGHPLIGAAVALHAGMADPDKRVTWTFDLNRKSTEVVTERRGAGWWAEMAQGRPEFLGQVAPSRRADLLAALNCHSDDLHDELPIEVVSLGLPYVLVPLRRGLATARIVHSDFASLLGTIGAAFVYVFDVNASEGRTWDNDGVIEDVATGSAAGPVGAYLTKHNRLTPEKIWTLNQGRFAGRPSKLLVRTGGSADDIHDVWVSGSAFIIGSGTLGVLPDLPPQNT